jgi:hypothetical protein
MTRLDANDAVEPLLNTDKSCKAPAKYREPFMFVRMFLTVLLMPDSLASASESAERDLPDLNELFELSSVSAHRPNAPRQLKV